MSSDLYGVYWSFAVSLGQMAKMGFQISHGERTKHTALCSPANVTNRPPRISVFIRKAPEVSSRSAVPKWVTDCMLYSTASWVNFGTAKDSGRGSPRKPPAWATWWYCAHKQINNQQDCTPSSMRSSQNPSAQPPLCAQLPSNSLVFLPTPYITAVELKHILMYANRSTLLTDPTTLIQINSSLKYPATNKSAAWPRQEAGY